MPTTFANEARARGSTFYCPRGHALVYGKGQVEVLKERLETERSNASFWRAQTQQAERRVSAAKGQVTKIKKRVLKGVCPFCNRSFSNVAAHMDSQHHDLAHPEEREA